MKRYGRKTGCTIKGGTTRVNGYAVFVRSGIVAFQGTERRKERIFMTAIYLNWLQ